MDNSSPEQVSNSPHTMEANEQVATVEEKSQPHQNEANQATDEAVNKRFKRKYQMITQEIRENFIKKVLSKEVTIREAAKEFGLKFSTSKAILGVYKKEGRIGKKKIRERKYRTINALAVTAAQPSTHHPEFSKNSPTQGNSVGMSDEKLVTTEVLMSQMLSQHLSQLLPEKNLIFGQSGGQGQQNLGALNCQLQEQYLSAPLHGISVQNTLCPQPLMNTALQKMQFDNLIKENLYYQHLLHMQNEQNQLLRNKILLQNMEVRSQMYSGVANLPTSQFFRVNTITNSLTVEPVTMDMQNINSLSLPNYGLLGSYPTKRVFY